MGAIDDLPPLQQKQGDPPAWALLGVFLYARRTRSVPDAKKAGFWPNDGHSA
jgi:hypothetical protein